MRTPLRLWIATGVLGLGLLVLLAVGADGRVFGSRPRLEDFGAAPAFTLIDQLERPASSEELRGKVVVTNFVYTNCRETCPLLSAGMQSLHDRLRQEGLLDGQVQLLSFTVDAAQDNPSALRAYAERYRADHDAWRFLTGPEEEMARLIEKGFLLGIQKVPPGPNERFAHLHEDGTTHEHPYDVMHSNRFVLIDREWRMRAYYDGLALDLDRVLRDVRELL